MGRTKVENGLRIKAEAAAAVCNNFFVRLKAESLALLQLLLRPKPLLLRITAGARTTRVTIYNVIKFLGKLSTFVTQST